MIRLCTYAVAFCALPAAAGLSLAAGLIQSPRLTAVMLVVAIAACVVHRALSLRDAPPARAKRSHRQPPLLMIVLVALTISAIGGFGLGLSLQLHRMIATTQIILVVVPAVFAWLVIAACVAQQAWRRKRRGAALRA